jgi:hypothetical protein
VSERLTVLFLVTLFTVGLIAIATAAPRGSSHPAPIHAPISSSQTHRQPRVDLSGDDVNDAVATYKLDPTGSLYEEHSPQTEVPRLRPPKT